METLEGNKLIAEFLGYKKRSFVTGYAGTFFYKGKERFCQLESMKYHTSWDWLMPVVDKIEALKIHFNIDQDSCEVFSGIAIVHTTIYNTAETKIKCVWETVVQVIELLNRTQNGAVSDTTGSPSSNTADNKK